MKSSRTYFKRLEKKSSNSLSRNQLLMFSEFIRKEKFRKKDNPVAILFAHKDNYKKAKSNRYFKFVKKHIYKGKVYAIISPIVNRYYMNNKNAPGFFLAHLNGKSTKIILHPVKNYKHFGLQKIVNSGQTGVEQGALVAAKTIKLLTGGYCPCKYITEDGINNDLKIFGLSENTKSANFKNNVKLNVINSDATMLLGKMNKDNKELKKFLIKNKKPFMHILHLENVDKYRLQIVEWIILNNIKTLHVTGNRNSVNKTVYERTFNFIVNTFSRNGLVKDFINKNYDSILDYKNYWLDKNYREIEKLKK